jgi:hypothetical protein
MPHRPWPDARAPNMPYTLNRDRGASGELLEGVRKQVTRMLRELGFAPKGQNNVYQQPYPEYFDTVSYPTGFRVLDFIKFTGDDNKTTYEHVG